MNLIKYFPLVFSKIIISKNDSSTFNNAYLLETGHMDSDKVISLKITNPLGLRITIKNDQVFKPDTPERNGMRLTMGINSSEPIKLR